MNILLSFFFLGLGCIIGSFLNVVVLRFNTGKNLQGRSSCYSCKHVLSWYELIPVLSWLVQRGRCRSCSSKISTQYIEGEILTGLLFLAAFLRGLWSGVDVLSFEYLFATAFLCLTFAFLVVVFLYDLKHKIIPDRLSIYFGVLGLCSMFFFGFDSGVFQYIGPHVPSVGHVLAMGLVPLPFVLLWLISRGKYIGLGDPKLMVGIAAFLGLKLGFSAVFLSFWIGTVFVIFMGLYYYLIHNPLLVNKSKKSIMEMEIPFGPFLILGFVTVILSRLSIFL